jgi:hypothetical protein
MFNFSRPVHRGKLFCCSTLGLAPAAAAALWATPALGQATNLFGTVTFSTVDGNDDAYAVGDTNSCAIALNNLTTETVGSTTYQFCTYYTTTGELMLARRSLGSSTWTVDDSGINDNTTADSEGLADDHDVIAMAVDSTGVMHLSWGMHNNSLNYAVSTASVMGSSFAPSFSTLNATNSPTLFPNSGATTNEVTYPQFYNIPGSSDLLFTYRNGGSGGGSGNGNQYFDVYNPTTKTWTNNYVIDGELTSVNAYLNSMVYTTGATPSLLMSWTWRATPNWQTNQNIMFAQSPVSSLFTNWFKQGGSTQYALPIIENTVSGSGGDTNTHSVAQTIWDIPQNSSFINQTSMTVDANNNPFIASYWAPGTTGSTNANDAPNSTTNNPNRQYMLVYYTGTTWKTSQVSDRTSDTAFDTSGADVRDLGRPIVLIDKAGRVLVVTRSENTAMGSYDNPATPNNDIVVYWNTVTSLDSADPSAWQQIDIDPTGTNMGEYEPTYDMNLWQMNNTLDLFYEPMGLTGETSADVQVLNWNESAYFAAVPEPVSSSLLAGMLGCLLLRRRPRGAECSVVN